MFLIPLYSCTPFIFWKYQLVARNAHQPPKKANHRHTMTKPYAKHKCGGNVPFSCHYALFNFERTALMDSAYCSNRKYLDYSYTPRLDVLVKILKYQYFPHAVSIPTSPYMGPHGLNGCGKIANHAFSVQPLQHSVGWPFHKSVQVMQLLVTPRSKKSSSQKVYLYIYTASPIGARYCRFFALLAHHRVLCWIISLFK